MKATVTLTPDYIKVRSNRKEVKFKISHEKAIELVMRWRMPMNTWRFFETMSDEDKNWVSTECVRVITERNKINQLLILELNQLKEG